MDVKKTLKDLNLSWSSRFSQNFLRSEQIADRIVECGGIEPQDTVIEIGTGLGILTQALAKKAQKVITFEIDKKIIAHLPALLEAHLNTEIIPEDFLKYDLNILRKRFSKVKVVSNLPYHLSTEIMFRLFECRQWVESMTLMFQREVARRIVSPPGNKDYGILSVLSQLYADVEILFPVAPNCFYPIPKVSSSVVHFKIKPHLLVEPALEGFFIRVVKASFGQRRKTLLNALQKIASSSEIKRACDQTHIDTKRRAETLSLQEFKKLTESLVVFVNLT